MIQMFGKSLWVVLPFVSAAAVEPWHNPLEGWDTCQGGSCSPARVGSGSEALSWAENTLQLATHTGQLISI